MGDPLAVTAGALARLEEIACAAGRAILSRYDTPGTVELKDDRTPVTAADRAAHGVIADALAAWDPVVPIVSEEAVLPPYEVRRAWRRFWLVDPLDGTKEFLRRNGEFTVNIALIDGGAPVLGVVHAPALELTYVAGRGLGAWRRGSDGAAVRLASRAPAPGAPLVVVESRSHPSPELEAFLATVPVKTRVRVGSSLKFCWVADGRADLYPRFGRTMEWDVAAGDCVFRESGAEGPRASPLTYNKPDLANGSFVIGGS